MRARFHQAGQSAWLLGPLAVCFSTMLLVAHATHRPWSGAGIILFAAGVTAAYALDYWADQPTRRPQSILLLAAFATLAGFTAAWMLPGWKILLAAALGTVGLAYRHWKKWPLMKTFLVAGAWTLAGVSFPVQWDARDLLLAPFGGALLAVFASGALLCDLKDDEADTRAGVRTAVVLWGRRPAAILAGALAVGGVLAALAADRRGLAGAGLALATLAVFPKVAAQPILGPALVDAALALPAVLILAGLA